MGNNFETLVDVSTLHNNMLRAAHVAVLDESYGLGTVQNVISPSTAFNNLDNQLNLIPPYCVISDHFSSRNGDPL